jgi:hypothetical protein
MDLYIADAGKVAWGEGLLIDEQAEVAYRGPGGKLGEAVRQQGAITVESWVAIHGDIERDHAVCRLQLEDDKFTFRSSSRLTPVVPGDDWRLPVHVVQVLAWRDGRVLLTTFLHGKQIGESDLCAYDASAPPSWLQGAPIALRLAPDASSDGSPMQCDLRLVAIYAGALTPQEVARNEASGLPQAGRARRGPATAAKGNSNF